MIAADRAVRHMGGELDGVEVVGQCVVGQQLACQQLAGAGDKFDGLQCLQAADDARHCADDACLFAGGDGVLGRGIFEHAPIARTCAGDVGHQLTLKAYDTRVAKGLLRRPARIMVVGLPNVGKSSIINKLTKSSKTKTGAKAGVTRQQQWVRINPQLELLDTPGIIPMKQEDQERATKLAFVNSVGDNAYSNDFVAKELLNILNDRQILRFKEYYNLDDNADLALENIAYQRKWLIKNQEPDIERTAGYLLKDFREGKIGKFILDVLP